MPKHLGDRTITEENHGLRLSSSSLPLRINSSSTPAQEHTTPSTSQHLLSS
ncbi:hypothetical protein Scep_007390 [Stephania cephalantha]|uniref:Uncharacterized protein n=1 Tax=Stephania cephalantha TaxID=152367 RepID=A0AAP0K9P8_9MAGN